MSRSSATPVERMFAIAFFAPIGLAAKLIEEYPSNVVKARQHVAFARFIGKMAVDRGVKELQARIEAVDEPAERPSPRSTATATAPDDASTPETVDAATVAHDDLALPDYDHLPAAHIVGKLAGLTQVERDDIEAYEAANRHRRTVLGKLTQLSET